MSDWPFTQQPDNCLETGTFDCFEYVREGYLQDLRSGFLTEDGRYHPALGFVSILNEPEFKVPPRNFEGTLDDTRHMAKAVISAFDGMLDAELEAGVRGAFVNFTATFSFAICERCGFFKDKPALGQMAEIKDAMLHPELYGYSPTQNITKAYLTRFTNSFNSFVPARILPKMFLRDYVRVFPHTPVYTGEYHAVDQDQSVDLKEVLRLAKTIPLFLGISFFEFQVSYQKAEEVEQAYGIFGLGDKVLSSMEYFGLSVDVRCLLMRPTIKPALTLPEAITRAYGGEGLDWEPAICEGNTTNWNVTSAR